MAKSIAYPGMELDPYERELDHAIKAGAELKRAAEFFARQADEIRRRHQKIVRTKAARSVVRVTMIFIFTFCAVMAGSAQNNLGALHQVSGLGGTQSKPAGCANTSASNGGAHHGTLTRNPASQGMASGQRPLSNELRGVEQHVARQAHNLKVAGANPAPATNRAGQQVTHNSEIGSNTKGLVAGIIQNKPLMGIGAGEEPCRKAEILCVTMVAHTRVAPADCTVAESNAVRAIVGEASGEGARGMLAVACAIRNRGTLRGVYGVNARHILEQRPAVWRTAREAWRLSATNDITGGATHWENTRAFGTPSWAQSMRVTARIGHHTFFKVTN